MTARRLTALILTGLLAVLVSMAPAWAFWATSTSPSTPPSVVSDSLAAPSSGNLSGVTASSVSINITGAPSTGAAPTGYRVDRTGGSTTTANVCGGISGTTGSCTDTGLSGSTLYSYAVFSRLGTNWVSAASFPLSTTTLSSDVTAPVTVATLSPLANAASWNRANVVVNLAATDNPGGSGVKSITFSASGAQTINATTVLTSSGGSTPAITVEGVTTVTYAATDVANNVETPKTVTVSLDKTGPTNALSLTSQTGGSFLNGNQVFYKGGAGSSGSFAIRNAVVDTRSGPKSSGTAALGGTSAGWSHTASTVATPLGGPFTSNLFSWVAGTSTSPTEVVTSTDVADNTTSATALTFTNDVAAPTGGALVVNGQSASSTATSSSFTIGTRTNYAETGSATASGLASSVLTVQSTSYNGTSCGAAGSGGPFLSATTIAGTTQPGGILGGFCYIYVLTGTDNVGNSSSLNLTVTVTQAYAFTVTSPGTQAAGTAFGGIQLQLQADGVNTTSYYGTAYTGAKTIAVTGASSSPNGTAPVLPTSVTFTNGAATFGAGTFNLRNAAATTLTITASAPTIAGATAPFTVNPLAPTLMAFANCITSTTSATCTPQPIIIDNNSSESMNIDLEDSFGNVSKPASPVTISLSLSNTTQYTLDVTSVSVATNATRSGALKASPQVNNATLTTITAHATSGSYADVTLQIKK